MSASAHTAAVLALRKVLMHIAVDCGAAEGGTFASYITYLKDEHYVPPRAVGWIDKIRTSSNEANHTIRLVAPEEANELLVFSEMLLKLVYEYPAIGSAPARPPSV